MGKLLFNKKTALVAIALAIVAAVIIFTRRENQEPVEIFALSAIVVDANSGRILYEKNPHLPLLPSSITKLAALLPVFEAIDDGRISFDTEVTVSLRAAMVLASQAGFSAGDIATVYGLIMASMLPSGSEAIMALGEFLYGTEEDFVAAINEAVARIGMENTRFTSSAGLDHADHFTTAHDISLLARHFIAYHPGIFDFTSNEYYVYQMPGGERLQMRNTNDMLRFNSVNGLKTGSSPASGSSLVFTNTRGRTTQVYVVLSAPNYLMRVHDTELLLRRFGSFRGVFRWI